MKIARSLALLALLGSGGFVAWRALKSPPPPRPNVVLAVIDTLRADAVSAYGRVEGTTPHIDALAGDGLLFEHAYANANWTLPSHATLFTGLLPEQHGVRAGDDVLESVATLAEILGAAGYETVAVNENPWIGPKNGLIKGFETFQHVTSKNMVGAVDRWLQGRQDDRPVFLFLNIMDAHSPYTIRETNPYLPESVSLEEARSVSQVPKDHLCRRGPDDPVIVVLRSLYLGDTRAADAKLDAVLSTLDSLRAEQPLILVVTSDHGEHFGEHKLVEHHVGIDNVLLHVPLVVNGLPATAPARIAAPVQLADIMPSILHWAGEPLPAGLAGQVLPTTASAGDQQRPLLADFHDYVPATLAKLSDSIRANIEGQFDACDESARVSGDMQALIRYPYKLNVYEKFPPQLFDLRVDPAEERDLATELPQKVQELTAALAAIGGNGHRAQKRGLDTAEIERLRALGYLGGPDSKPPADDGG